MANRMKAPLQSSAAHFMPWHDLSCSFNAHEVDNLELRLADGNARLAFQVLR